MTEQTVNWTDQWSTLRRMHVRRAVRRRPDTWVALAVLLLIAAFQPTWRVWLLGGVVVVGLIVLLGTVMQLRALRQAAEASGQGHFRFDGQTLYVSNTFGEFRIPRSQIKRLIPDPEGLIVEYTAASALSLPNGPVKDALLARQAPHSKEVTP